jgi:hypothetical protein
MTWDYDTPLRLLHDMTFEAAQQDEHRLGDYTSVCIGQMIDLPIGHRTQIH